MITRGEELILLAVWQLGDAAYSVRIREWLMDVSGKFWSFGAVYMPLDRLHKRGLLDSYLADPTPERGGRAKRIYKPTKDGLAALDEIKQIQETAWSGIAKLSLGRSC